MNIRRLYYSQKPNMYPAYLIDTFLHSTAFDEWDFSIVKTYGRSSKSYSHYELVQVLNPDLISKMKFRSSKTKLSSETVHSR